jgi:hypothetical protein
VNERDQGRTRPANRRKGSIPSSSVNLSVEAAHWEQAGDWLVLSESANPLGGKGYPRVHSSCGCHRLSTLLDSASVAIFGWRRVGGSSRGFCLGCSAVCNPCGFTFGWRHRAAARATRGKPRARCRSADWERVRILQVVLFGVLPANVWIQTSWCLYCYPLMGTAILVKRGSRLLGARSFGILAFARRRAFLPSGRGRRFCAVGQSRVNGCGIGVRGRG